ncbi:hypothetical protein GA830_08745 [Mesorhizobium sp. NBSH29]|uniref:class I SAM-dependent methyltransferase n=1 Tax=Mesorhizobium sp. NBSH29 TaxID=2654249 RepID=UPI001896A4C0|nr:class I SAM-dependent methyltransferase [Mesorhizobium sp. NBSH29]QPC86814.1 hypothetical protein GA830_08745 [Mesorhizobium sp. NBSH29]
MTSIVRSTLIRSHQWYIAATNCFPGNKLRMNFNISSISAATTHPQYLSGHSAWVEHIPFAFFAVATLAPRRFVELGTHYGDSYCAFCQAAVVLGAEAPFSAIDTWEGDEHAGLYDSAVLAQLRTVHDARYGEFSSLVQSRFDDAAKNFEPASIDLLHIDGLHTYEAVKADFEAWLPLMSERGVILFHDTDVRRDDFGVWKLWEELVARYPSFTFHHGHGLGVLGVGSEIPNSFGQLLECSDTEAEAVRQLFANLGRAVSRAVDLSREQAAHRETAEKLLRAEALTRQHGDTIQAVTPQQEAIEALTAQHQDAVEALTSQHQQNIAVLTRQTEDKIAALQANAQAQAEDAERKIIHLSSQLRSAHGHLRLMENSRSWRWTRPLRRS